jgi:hypothetical protein
MESKAGSKLSFLVRLYRETASHFSGRTLDNKRLDAVSPLAAIFTRVQKFAMALT